MQNPALISAALTGAGSWWVACQVRDEWRASGAALDPDGWCARALPVRRRWPLVAAAAACLLVAALV